MPLARSADLHHPQAMKPALRFALLAPALTCLHLAALHLVGIVVLQSFTMGALQNRDLWSIWIWIAIPVAVAQAAALALPAPNADFTASPGSLRARAFVAGAALTLALALPIYALADLPTWFDLKLTSDVTNAVWTTLTLALPVTWVVLSLLLAHRTKGEPDLLERRTAQATAGTLVGLALCTPWYLVLRRKQQCVCALGTFWALIVGLWSLLLVGGPLLLWLARVRQRAAVRAS